MMSLAQLRELKYYLIGTITKDNKKEVNRQLRECDKLIKRLLTTC
jgi:hypothetical protein